VTSLEDPFTVLTDALEGSMTSLLEVVERWDLEKVHFDAALRDDLVTVSQMARQMSTIMDEAVPRLRFEDPGTLNVFKHKLSNKLHLILNGATLLLGDEQYEPMADADLMQVLQIVANSAQTLKNELVSDRTDFGQ
jgi:hypothetical protein